MYTVNESMIDSEGTAVFNEPTLSTSDLHVALRHMVGRLDTHKMVRGLVFEQVAHQGDAHAVIDAWAPVPESTFEVYIGIQVTYPPVDGKCLTCGQPVADCTYQRTLCGYCREVVADSGYDRCLACRTWRDEEWCEANGHQHGVPVQRTAGDQS